MQINVAGSRSSSSARHWAGFLVLRMFRTCDMCHMCIFSKAQCIFYNSWLVLQKLPLHVAGRIWTHLCASGRLRRCIDPCRWWRAQCCNLQETKRGTGGRCRDLLSALNLPSQHDNSKSSQDILKISEIRMSDLNQYEHGMKSQENNMVKMLFPNLVYMFLAMT